MTFERKDKTFHPQYPARGFAWADGPLVSLALTDPGLEPLVHLRPCFPRRALYKVVPAGTPRFFVIRALTQNIRNIWNNEGSKATVIV